MKKHGPDKGEHNYATSRKSKSKRKGSGNESDPTGRDGNLRSRATARSRRSVHQAMDGEIRGGRAERLPSGQAKPELPTGNEKCVSENLPGWKFKAARPKEKRPADGTEFKWYKGTEVHKVYLGAMSS